VFLFRFEYKCDVTSSTPGAAIQDNPRFYVELRLGVPGSGAKYLRDGATNKPELRSPLESLEWSANESWITIDVEGDNMDAWTEFTLELPELPSDAGDGIRVFFSECDYGDYSAGTDTLAIREAMLFKKDENGDFDYEDVKVIGENTALSNGKRFDLGELHFYDFPKIDFRDTSSAVYTKCVFDTGGTSNVDDIIRFELDGASQEYTYKAVYNLGSRHWTNLTELKQLLYAQSNNYIISTSGDTLTIEGIEYDIDNINPVIVTDPSGDWSLTTDTDKTEPTTGTAFVNPASISDDATPTTMANYSWHAVTQETTGTEDTSITYLRLERELARRGKASQFLQGTYFTVAEDTNHFGGIIGLLTSSTQEDNPLNYRAVSIRSNTHRGETEIVMEKVYDESVTFTGLEVYE
jgi:hypothetical protein